jgi:putative lipoprotein
MPPKTRIPAALAALMATACASEPPTQPPLDLADTQWVAEEIGGQPVADGVESSLSIDANSRASGTGGCNRYFGDVAHSDGTISFGPLGSTRMACPETMMDQEQRFFAALETSRSYRQDDLTGLLYFQDEAGDDILRFRRMRKIEESEQ